jgi:lambda family phage minor tail protein L
MKLGLNNIYWQGNQYTAMPIQAEGFDISTQGTLPTPKLSFSVNDEGLPIITTIRQRMQQLGDLSGAKVTRRRVFAKYLDANNFPNERPPEGFSPNRTVELPPDIFYIDRKSIENKFIVEFELATLLEVEGIKLPSRMCIEGKCVWQFRGEGCLYERPENKTFLHGDGVLPSSANNLYTVNNEKIEDIVGVKPLYKGEWKLGSLYFKGDWVYVEKQGLKYHFVCKTDNPLTGPPNLLYWAASQCSKTILGCELHYGKNVSLPFGGFAGVNRIAG